MSLYELLRKCHDRSVSIGAYYDSEVSCYVLTVGEPGSISSSTTVYFPKQKINSLTETDVAFLVDVLIDTTDAKTFKNSKHS